MARRRGLWGAAGLGLIGMQTCQGDKVVKMNIDGVDASIAGIVECEVPAAWASLAVDTEARASRASNCR